MIINEKPIFIISFSKQHEETKLLKKLIIKLLIILWSIIIIKNPIKIKMGDPGRTPISNSKPTICHTNSTDL